MTFALAKIPLFASLPPDEIEHLERVLPLREFAPGKILLQEKLSDEKFFILLEGEVEIIKALGREEERILGVRGPGSLLGEMSLFSHHGQHTAGVRSLTTLRLLEVPRTELDALLHRQPLFAYEILRLLSQRLEDSENTTILDLKEKNQRLQQAYADLKAAQEQIIEKEKLEKELQISAQIQRSILPDQMPACPGFEFGALMIPARQVGGDFYTFINLGKDRLGLVVGDVSDKGVPAALFMTMTYSLVLAETVRTLSPVQALRQVNQHLLQLNASSMFVTLVYGILDLDSGVFHYARAGHPLPFLVDGKGQVVEVPVAPGQPLGLFDDLPLDEQKITLPPGGILLLYSDGVSETADVAGVEFGLGSLCRSLDANRLRSAQEICEQTWQAVQAHGTGLPQQDDFTIVAVKRTIGGKK